MWRSGINKGNEILLKEETFFALRHVSYCSCLCEDGKDLTAKRKKVREKWEAKKEQSQLKKKFTFQLINYAQIMWTKTN